VIFASVSGVCLGLLLALGVFALMVMAIMDEEPPIKDQPHHKKHVVGDIDVLRSQAQEIIYH